MDSDKSTTEGDAFGVTRLGESAQKAEEEAHVQPSPVRRGGGRMILALQSLIDKLLGGRLVQMQEQVIKQDRELSALAQDLAELSIMVVQINRRLEVLDQRLARLEEPAKPPDES